MRKVRNLIGQQLDSLDRIPANQIDVTGRLMVLEKLADIHTTLGNGVEQTAKLFKAQEQLPTKDRGNDNPLGKYIEVGEES